VLVWSLYLNFILKTSKALAHSISAIKSTCKTIRIIILRTHANSSFAALLDR